MERANFVKYRGTPKDLGFLVRKFISVVVHSFFDRELEVIDQEGDIPSPIEFVQRRVYSVSAHRCPHSAFVGWVVVIPWLGSVELWRYRSCGAARLG